ncbi:MAG TPA: hypothetical protein VGE45_00415 [Chloroflexia bacterium]
MMAGRDPIEQLPWSFMEGLNREHPRPSVAECRAALFIAQQLGTARNLLFEAERILVSQGEDSVAIFEARMRLADKAERAERAAVQLMRGEK